MFGNIGVQCGWSGEGLGEEEGSHQEGPTGWPQHSATQKPTGMFEEGSDPTRLRVTMITLAAEGRKARGEVRPVVGEEGRGCAVGQQWMAAALRRSNQMTGGGGIKRLRARLLGWG